MRTAPPVSVSCTGGSVWRWAQSAVPALAIAAWVAWAAGHRAWPADQAAVAALLSAAVVGGFVWWRAAPRVLSLQWDGQQWWANGSTVNAVVMMELPHWLLIRLHAQGGLVPRWAAVSATEAGPAWHGLRVALFAHRPPLDAGPLADLGPHV
jgi:hypothetical protein